MKKKVLFFSRFQKCLVRKPNIQNGTLLNGQTLEMAKLAAAFVRCNCRCTMHSSPVKRPSAAAVALSKQLHWKRSSKTNAFLASLSLYFSLRQNTLHLFVHFSLSHCRSGRKVAAAINIKAQRHLSQVQICNCM